MRLFTTVAERKDRSGWDIIAGPNSDFVAQDAVVDKLIAAKGVVKQGKATVEYGKAIITEVSKGARRRRSF
jgi:hypothetical protein